VTRKLPVADAGTAACGDDAFVNTSLLYGNAELFCRVGEQQLARLRGRVTQRRTAFLNRAAARSNAFIRAVGRVGGSHANPLDRHIELFGHDLSQRVEYALPTLDFAREHCHRLVAVDPQPAVEPAIDIETTRQRAGRDGL